jgi:hypothetical protein
MPPRIGRTSHRPANDDTCLPPLPPPCVSRDVERAARRAEELAGEGWELHFELSADQRVAVQVRDAEGRVARAIRPSEALEVLSGGPLRPRMRSGAG